MMNSCEIFEFVETGSIVGVDASLADLTWSTLCQQIHTAKGSRECSCFLAHSLLGGGDDGVKGCPLRIFFLFF